MAYGFVVYVAGQPSFTSAMLEAYQQIDPSVDDFLRGARIASRLLQS
jgi:hypothetical protein